MNRIIKLCAWVLILSVLNLQVAAVALAAQNTQVAKLDTIKKNLPEMVASPELNLPGQKPDEKKSYNWVWWVVGAVVLGAAVGGGGGGGGSTPPPNTITPPSNGAVAVGW
jgi:hypothetical protein